MDIKIILKVLGFIFFNLPLIINVGVLISLIVEFVREKELNFSKVIAIVIGGISIIISSIILKTIPESQFAFFDRVTYWIEKSAFVLFISLAIFDTSDSERCRWLGVKALAAVSVSITGMNLISKVFG